LAAPIEAKKDSIGEGDVKSAPLRWATVTQSLLTAGIGFVLGLLLWGFDEEGEGSKSAEPYLRFAIEPSGEVYRSAISPDGRKVAYISAVGSAVDLWVHDISLDRPMRIEGLDLGIMRGAVYHGPELAWSADSDRIFIKTVEVGSDAIKSVLASGGGAGLILRAPQISSLTHDSARNRAIYGDSAHARLRSVSLSGGAPETLFGTVEPAGDWGGWSPSISPLAPRVLFYGTIGPIMTTRARGVTVGKLGQPQMSIGLPALSPDQLRVAVVASDEHVVGDEDVWVHDVNTALKTRLTFDAKNEDRPVWTPDGSKITFSAGGPSGARNIFQVRSAGGAPALLREDKLAEFAFDWSPDGRILIFDKSPHDIWLLERQGSGDGFEARPFLEDAFDSYAPDFSPDGRFVAYVSNESGRYEVYVRPFPDGAGRWQISLNGGEQPRWRGDSGEIYYVEGRTLMAAQLRPGSQVEVVDREPLFSHPTAFQARGHNYDVTRDGKRFVIVETIQEPPPARIRIVQNWFERFREQE
jgi:Tol biopolymer transport system component